MELKDLGFDQWFQEKLKELQKPGYSAARVTAVDRDSFVVRNENGEVPAELSGRLIFSAESSTDFPTVGDWAFVQYHNSNTLAVIHELFPRKSVLKRKAAGKRIDHQMIASNIDAALIIQSCDYNFNLRRLERYLVMVNEGHIEPIIILSKSDLVSEEELAQRVSEIRKANIKYKTIAFSNKTSPGPDHVRRVLEAGKTYCLLGSSGVGKTTLLNHLVGRDAFKTNIVREKDGRGRHTTTRRQLILLDQGAMLIDTPGMRELGNIGADSGIDDSFSDIKDLSRGCRFTDCTHTCETGCAVLTALENGELSRERYLNYTKLVKESDYYQASYAEKRKKDRKFGQFCKSVMKYNKKR
ncbi:MAG: ribosome small subunit-dependent GTPase A [Bacillota bacterium]